MTVRKKIVLIVFVVISLFLSFNLLVDYFYVLGSLEDLEMDEGKKGLKRAALAIDRDLEHLSLLCYDWAEWDDSCHFIEDRNEVFINSNLLENTFLHNHLALLFFIDKAGQVVWGSCYSDELGEFISITEFPGQKWPAGHPLLQHSQNDSIVKGYLQTSAGVLMLASRPVVPSSGSGGIRGTLIMGRLVCDRCIELMRERTQLGLEIWSINDETLLPVDCYAKDQLKAETPTFFVRNQDWIFGYTVLDDIYSRPVLLLRTKSWRTIYKRSRNGIMVGMLCSLLAAIVVGLLISYLLHRSISRPLACFVKLIADIGASEDIRKIDVHPESDEIRSLQREFNQMVQRLHDDSRKRESAEVDLRDSEARLSAVLNAAPDGILTIDAAGIIKTVNQAAVEMFGYEVNYLPGKSILILSEPQRQTLLHEEIIKFRKDPESSVFSFGVEVSGVRRDGSHILLHCKIGRVEVEGADLFICIVRDVSGLKEIHEKLMRTKHLASIGEMGASIAHEIRNPLAGISGAVQVLTDMSSVEQPEYETLLEISRLTGCIEETVCQMLEYAKDWQPEPSLVSIVNLINEIISVYSRQIDLQDITIRVEGSSEIRALIDPELIGQVLVNLMANAVAACGGLYGELVWRVERNLREVYISLQDNGSGIDDDVQKSVFKPFFTTRENGNGLGLAICQKIIERHNGSITLESEVNVGSKVTIILPKSKFLRA